MTPHVRALAATLVIAAGCAREAPQPDRTPSPDIGRTGSIIGASAKWDDSLGTVIAIPSPDDGSPVAFLGDTSRSGTIEVELFGHEARTTRAVLERLGRSRTCAWRRPATLAPSAGSTLPATWSLALAPGVADAVDVHAIGEMTPRDSAALAAQVHRLVSALPDDSAAATFRGLPIVVRDAWRVELDSTQLTIAIASRALNIESNPQAEVTTLIAEATSGAEWATAFARRDAGAEDRVEGADLLTVLRLSTGRHAIVFLREDETGAQIDVVERQAPGRWRMRWTSAALPCAR